MSEHPPDIREQKERNNNRNNLPDNSAEELATAEIVDNARGIEIRDFDAVSNDHPLVQEIGARAKQTDASGGGQFIAEEIYGDKGAWSREWQQNHETACIRASKLLVRLSDEYPDGWLTNEIPVNEQGETVSWDEVENADCRTITVPRPIEEVINAAKKLGYKPTIVWDVYLDEKKIVTEDNGIGMTPREFWQAFESPFSSGSGVDSETGGMFGVGSESVRMVYGDEGGAEIYSHSRRPSDHEGFGGYTYSGGATAIPSDLDDDFRGTRFEIPVADSFPLYKLQDWVEHYSQMLRVPVLYREHNSGETVVEEEYPASNFINEYGDQPIEIQRPGEFSLVAGPDVIDTSYNADDEDTFLVSMPINRNQKSSMSTMWTVVIQIHDEQGRIIAGPNRGLRADEMDKLHEDDVPTPKPTGDRDRLKKTENSKKFFNYIENLVRSRELERAATILEEVKEADHPAEVFTDKNKWDLHRAVVEKYGRYNATERQYEFEDHINDRDCFPDISYEKVTQMFNLFSFVERCVRGPHRSTEKGGRSEIELGKVIATAGSDPVYMAASTGGKFTQYFKVVENTYEDATIIVINGARVYDKYKEQFGFKVLKNVPLTHETEEEPHDYDVPSSIHDDNINKGNNRGKANDLLEREMKFRTDNENTSIDYRLTIEKTKERLENGGTFGGHSKIVLFPQTGDEKISNNYDLSQYVAIASVSKKEHDELKDYDNVLTPSEFRDWSRSALIATEDGAMTPKELVDDDRMVVLAYRTQGKNDVVKLLGDEYEELRQHYANDIHDQVSWVKELDDYVYGYNRDNENDVDESEKPGTLFAVAGKIVLNRAEWAFGQMDIPESSMLGLKLERKKYGRRNPVKWRKLDGNTTTYRLMVETPNWDNESEIYDKMPVNRDSIKAQTYLGLHDRGIDPTEVSTDELRDTVAECD